MSPTWTEISVRNAASPRSISSQTSASDDEVEPGAAVLLGDDDPEQAELGHALDDPQVEVVVDVVLDRVREHALVHERADGVLDQALLVGELEVHGGKSMYGGSVTWLPHASAYNEGEAIIFVLELALIQVLRGHAHEEGNSDENIAVARPPRAPRPNTLGRGASAVPEP